MREGWVRAGEGGCAGEGGLRGREGEGGRGTLQRGSVWSVAGSAVVVRVLGWRVIGWRTVVGVALFWGRGALALAVDLDSAFDEAFDFGLGASLLEWGSWESEEWGLTKVKGWDIEKQVSSCVRRPSLRSFLNVSYLYPTSSMASLQTQEAMISVEVFRSFKALDDECLELVRSTLPSIYSQ